MRLIWSALSCMAILCRSMISITSVGNEDACTGPASNNTNKKQVVNLMSTANRAC
jgi:hypothetical protein